MLNKHIATKFLDKDNAMTRQFRIETVAGSNLLSAKYLLGEYATTGSVNEFSGRQANPFNILIWQRLVDEFAYSVSQLCRVDQKAEDSYLQFLDLPAYKVDPVIAATVISICRSVTGPSEDLSPRLSELWHDFMGYGATTERDVWLAYFLGDGRRSYENPSDFVAALFWSMMLNPNFYLER